MISSPQTKLLLAVSVVAIAAVVAVALSARQTTRVEFRRFQEHEEEVRSSTSRSRAAAEIAPALTGRCRDADAVREAASRLAEREVLIVIDEQGRLIARDGPGVRDLRDLQVRLSGEELAVSITREQRGVTEGIALKFIGGYAPTVDCGGGTMARVHVFSIPSGPLGPGD